jgi:ABC-type Fe3+-siderophore transport system permease subunit
MSRPLSIGKLHKKKLRKVSPDFFCAICTKLKICVIYLLTNSRKCDIIDLGDAAATSGG